MTGRLPINFGRLFLIAWVTATILFQVVSSYPRIRGPNVTYHVEEKSRVVFTCSVDWGDDEWSNLEVIWGFKRESSYSFTRYWDKLAYFTKYGGLRMTLSDSQKGMYIVENAGLPDNSTWTLTVPSATLELAGDYDCWEDFAYWSEPSRPHGVLIVSESVCDALCHFLVVLMVIGLLLLLFSPLIILGCYRLYKRSIVSLNPLNHNHMTQN
ncbi:uncharacterized protein [Ptychodera flava]|uniref:uncharacterized protein isoform X2 n=1 Tax=Ptychodera flava TaxID=63121 RepID=UPI003969E5AA